MNDDSQRFDARVHLLDRQIHDCTGRTVAVVGDIELSDVPLGRPLPAGTPAPVVTDLLTGPVVATRIFGGRPPSSRWHRTAWEHVSAIGIAIELCIDGSELSALWVERWMCKHIIARIPGSRHDPQ